MNQHLIPVNAPRYPVHSYHRDGSMRVDSNHGSTIGYQPNSYGERAQQPDFTEPPLDLAGAAAHWNHREDQDYYSRLGKLFHLMTPAQQQALFDNSARSLGRVPKAIPLRHIGNYLKADPAYGGGVAMVLGITVDKRSGLR